MSAESKRDRVYKLLENIFYSVSGNGFLVGVCTSIRVYTATLSCNLKYVKNS